LARDVDFWEAVRRIRSADDRFAPELYAFVMEALEFTVEDVGERRHVEAGELLSGFAACARHRFGLLAPEVLAKWGVDAAFDVGIAVFQMVEAGLLSRRDSDSLDDFDQGFDLIKTIEEGYLE
jgi:uncharacterized repeat protein (TIGR04138 family)